jgi:hypothetical protein
MRADLINRCRTIDDSERSQHLKRLRSMGYTRINAGLDPELTKALLKKVQTQFERHKHSMAPVPSEWDARWVLNLQNKDKAFIDLLDLPIVESVMKAMLNDPYFRHFPPEAPNYILGQYVARSSVKPLQLHIDAGMPQPGPSTTMVQLGFVLEDMDEANGCTLIVPGSHLLGEYSDRELLHHHPLPAKAGDIVIWDARVWHGSGANNSDGTRWSIVATFQRWWIKQSFDMPRALPQAIFEQLSDRQKALIGFCTIPPLDETERRTRARAYSDLPSNVEDFYRR